MKGQRRGSCKTDSATSLTLTRSDIPRQVFLIRPLQRKAALPNENATVLGLKILRDISARMFHKSLDLECWSEKPTSSIISLLLPRLERLTTYVTLNSPLFFLSFFLSFSSSTYLQFFFYHCHFLSLHSVSLAFLLCSSVS